MTMQWLLGWWNLIFLLPFGLALMYLGIYTLSGWTFGEADADVDADADLDADTDLHLNADADIDTDTDLEADAEADTDVEADAEHDAGLHGAAVHGTNWLTLLSWLGVGRIPLSVLLMVLLMSWGFAGFISNTFLLERGITGLQMAMLSISIAFIASTLFTRISAQLIGKYFPPTSSPAMRRHQLLGSVGEAILPIDQHFGMVAVRNDKGVLYQVACRAEFGSIPTGSRVQLVAYSVKDQTFQVRLFQSTETVPVGVQR